MMIITRSAGLPPARCIARSRGFTLLEVLVSLGIIVGALAGIAALLPAAGARLADATDIDRASTMAANARAEVLTRGLTSATLWQQAFGLSPSTLAIVFGEGLTNGGMAVAMTSATTTIALAAPVVLATRVDPATGFRLGDQVQTSGVGAVTGFDPGVCYGCMLSATAAPSGPGAPIRLSTVVFRKPAAQTVGFALTRIPGSAVFQVTGTLTTNGSVVPLGGVDAASLRRQYLVGCTSILATTVSGQPPQQPRWVPIASSWTTFAPGETTGFGTGASFVSLSGTDWFGLVAGGTLQAFGFEGLLRVDERDVTLE